jgi:peptide/nickel transport system permease protein
VQPLKSVQPPDVVSAQQLQDETVAEIGHLSLWQLTWRRFLHNRPAVAGGVVLIILYGMVILADFLSPYNYHQTNEDYIFLAPQRLHFVDESGQFMLPPVVYGTKAILDFATVTWTYTEDPSQQYPLRFFVHGFPYKVFGVLPSNVHLFGVDEPGVYHPFGTDRMGRDLFALILYGGRVTLSVGLLGVALTLIFGSTLGTISGYYGGVVDTAMQRVIELLMCFPTIPLWAALAAAMPPDWSSVQRFFAISVILSLIGWTGLARQVRAKVLSYRQQDFATAAKAVGASSTRIIFVHMLPNALSHIIVVATLAIPNMILAESALSFLGLGIQPPLTSWGALLQEAQRVSVVLQKPWLLLPGIFIVVTVLAFNFLGDGLRDAADPYSA